MDSSDVIALVSAAVSGASLVCSIYSYASSKAAAKAAQDANKLSLHGYQRELFRAFQELRTYIATDQAVNELGVRSRFAEAQFSAALYLSPALAAEFRRIYALCLAITPIVSRQEFIYNGMNAASQAGDMEQAQLLGSSYMSADSERLRATSEAEATFARVADMLAEYRALRKVAGELVWLKRLLEELTLTLPAPIEVYCDSQSALHIARNPVFNERTKHIEVDCHFVRNLLKTRLISQHYISSDDQLADILTKTLTEIKHSSALSKLSVFSTPPT